MILLSGSILKMMMESHVIEDESLEYYYEEKTHIVYEKKSYNGGYYFTMVYQLYIDGTLSISGKIFDIVRPRTSK
jgi:hypothetical protein